MSEVICNAAHHCPITPCVHKVPHRHKNGWCGKGHHVCYASKLLSACVQVTDNTYKTVRRDWCKHCSGRGYEDVTLTHHWHGPGAIIVPPPVPGGTA